MNKQMRNKVKVESDCGIKHIIIKAHVFDFPCLLWPWMIQTNDAFENIVK